MTQEQLQQKVSESKAKGCKLPDDKIIAIILKAEKNAAKNNKKALEGFERREATKDAQAGNLWGAGQEFSTQAEYQRSLLGSKWNKK